MACQPVQGGRRKEGSRAGHGVNYQQSPSGESWVTFGSLRWGLRRKLEVRAVWAGSGRLIGERRGTGGKPAQQPGGEGGSGRDAEKHRREVEGRRQKRRANSKTSLCLCVIGEQVRVCCDPHKPGDREERSACHSEGGTLWNLQGEVLGGMPRGRWELRGQPYLDTHLGEAALVADAVQRDLPRGEGAAQEEKGQKAERRGFLNPRG